MPMKALIGRMHSQHITLIRLDAERRERWIVTTVWIAAFVGLCAFWGFLIYLAVQVVG